MADFNFFFYTVEIHRLDFPKIITYTRNYYTHYNLSLANKALKDGDLLNAYYFLKNILEFYLLKELGFNEDFIHNHIRKRIEPIRIGIDTKATNKN
ncbi:HEPN domain-containing protein [Bacillus sp. RM3]|uniref:HEPN domain-containing protein n=1 Tax=Bacillus TaxID=1386 RepID=UPI00345A4F74